MAFPPPPEHYRFGSFELEPDKRRLLKDGATIPLRPRAITMGNFYLANIEDKEIVVEKTLVFRRCRKGKLRLCAHKSALPYDPTK